MISLNIFTKCPMTGNPKQRMKELLDETGRSILAKILLENVLNEVNKINSEISKNLWVYPDINNKWIKNLSKKYSITLRKQIGNSLSDRMKSCLISESIISDKVIIIGSDIPTLTNMDILESIDSLKYNNIVIGPSHDDGFYLIGIKNAESVRYINDPNCLTNYKVIKNTLVSANQKVGLLRKLKDIDHPDDLLFV